jgi:cytidine deaminase
MSLESDTNLQIHIDDSLLQELASAAWKSRENAYVIGPTKVGCAVLGSGGKIFAGCNIEHRFRSHDIHAEVNAISTMVANGCKSISVILIAAERDRFTPCGACMDWIMQFGTADTLVLFQGKRNGEIQRYTSAQLMPYYPA